MTAMKKYVWFLGIMLISIAALSQNMLRIQVKDSSSNAASTPRYLFIVAMVGYNVTSHINLVLNCGNNLLDYRQSKHETLFEGSLINPQFNPLWAPIDGSVINLKLRLKK